MALSHRLKPLGRLDRYTLRLYGASYATAFVLVVGLFWIIDLATNLDEYLKAGADGRAPSGWLIAQYYAMHVPFLFLQVAPFVGLMAGVFAVARMVRDNEVVGVLGAGVSAQRLLAPILVCGGLLAGGMFALRESATEALSLRRALLLDQLAERRAVPTYEDLWLKDRAGSPVHLRRFTLLEGGASARVEGLSAVVIERGHWISLKADRASWDAAAGDWKLENGTREEVDPLEQRREAIERLSVVSFTPADVWLAQKSRAQPLDLSFREARQLAERDPDNTLFQTLLEYHWTFPLAHVVLLLVGLPYLLRFERGRSAEGLAVCFLLCLFYYGADFLARSLGIEGELSPLIACWAPLLCFGSLGVVLYGSARS